MSEVYLGKGSLTNRGVYASRDFKKGEVVIKYNLKALTQEEFANLAETEKQFTHEHHSTIHLYSVPERYVNHSLEPNTRQDFSSGCDIALRDISKDEMITTDTTKDDIE